MNPDSAKVKEIVIGDFYLHEEFPRQIYVAHSGMNLCLYFSRWGEITCDYNNNSKFLTSQNKKISISTN